MTAEIILESNNNNQISPLSLHNPSSLAAFVAEASLLSQEAAVKDADNLSWMINLQEEELELRKNDAVANREEQSFDSKH